MTGLKLELSQYYDEGGQFPMIKHPLVYAMFFDTAEEVQHLNKMLEAKQEQLERAELKHDWSNYVFLHERPYRVQAMLEIQSEIENHAYWPLLREIWVDSENIYAMHMKWWELLTSNRTYRHLFMDVEDRKLFKKHAQVFEAYRGTTEIERDGNYNGLSWTLDRDKAKWFATRFVHRDDGRPVVGTTLLDKDDCIGFVNSRGEQEVVVPHGPLSDIEWSTI